MGDCVTTCPIGTFANTVNRRCDPCDGNCTQYSGSATNCTACPSTLPILTDGVCSTPPNLVVTPLNTTAPTTVAENDTAITVPANAFNEPAELQVALIPEESAGIPADTLELPRQAPILSVVVVALAGDEPIQPNQPVEICFQLDAGASATAGLCLAFVNEAGFWECADTNLQAGANGLVCGETTHFTLFSVLETSVVEANLPPPSTSPFRSATPSPVLTRSAGASSSVPASGSQLPSRISTPSAQPTVQGPNPVPVPVPVPNPIPIPNPVPVPVPVPVPNPIPVPNPVPVPVPVP